MANLGPLFARTDPPEGRKLAREVSKPAGQDMIIVIDGKEARINWVSPEGKTAQGEYFEAGISFNSTDHSVWKIRKNPDGSWMPVRCTLYGRRNLDNEVRSTVDKFTRKA